MEILTRSQELVETIFNLKSKLCERRKKLAQINKYIEELKQPIIYEIVFDKNLKNKEQRDAELENRLQSLSEYNQQCQSRFDLYYEIKELENYLDYREKLFKIEFGLEKDNENE